MKPISILFVCMGNICRSPLAEGVFESVAKARGFEERFHVDSAGTGNWHIGNPPDPRSIAVAAKYGVDISGQRCRKLDMDDYYQFDHIIGMDRANHANIKARSPATGRAKIHMLMDVALGQPTEIPDPYMSGPEGFELAYSMVHQASEGLITKLVG